MNDNSFLRFGAVQSNHIMNVSENLNRAKQIVNDISDKCDVIVFPELYSTGYFMNEQYLNSNAETIDGHFISEIKKNAKINDVFIFMPFLERKKDILYNSVAIISNNGEVIGVKRKSINWKPENGIINEGVLNENLEVYQINDFKIGVLICYEASFPENARELALKKCDAILIPSFWSDSALNHWVIQLCARALDNNVYVLGVNGLLDNSSCGNTMGILPDGNIDVSLEKNEGILYFNINSEKLHEIQRKIPYFTDYLEYFES
ncbi:carbon-nitrogen hydrolase family protein [Clostridiaceae bacterium HSG29]|nr:carbon-nitrogen hydrolase family protein [Clostridiaceae bacterium HSG29]